MRFRDETQQVGQKVRDKARLKARFIEKAPPAQQYRSVQLPAPFPGPNLSPNLDDQALGFFFTHHVIGCNQQRSSSPSSQVNDTFITTGNALGLAGISNLMRTADLKRAA